MQRRSILSILLVGLTIIISVVACAERPEPNVTPTQPQAITTQVTQPPLLATTAPGVTPIGEETMPISPEKPGTSEPTENRLVTQAKEDLAERLSIDIAQIQLVEFNSVVWPDASMGCPQPGMAYTQVPQDGALIILAVGEKRYEYHSGGARPPFLCEKTAGVTPDEPPPGFGDE